MVHKSTNYVFRQKAVRVTMPLICDAHIDAVIDELNDAVADLRQIRKKQVHQFERVLMAQEVMQHTHINFMQRAHAHEMLKGLR